jgi:hypothetical protein
VALFSGVGVEVALGVAGDLEGVGVFEFGGHGCGGVRKWGLVLWMNVGDWIGGFFFIEKSNLR